MFLNSKYIFNSLFYMNLSFKLLFLNTDQKKTVSDLDVALNDTSSELRIEE